MNNSTFDEVKYFCLITLNKNQVAESITFVRNLAFNESGNLPAGLTSDDTTNIVFQIFLQTEQGEPVPIKLNSLAQEQDSFAQ